MLLYWLIDAFILCSMLVCTAEAGPFGVKTRGDGSAEIETDAEDTLVDTDDEQELIEAMEMFALMSEEERIEAFAEVVEMIGGDDADPEDLEALRTVMEAVELMNDADSTSMGYTPMEDAIADATGIALEMIAGSEWEMIREKSSEILDALIVSGKIGAEDAALFRSDGSAWEKELRSVWDELEKQAEESGNAKASDEL
ncbi:hypothetical protein ACHAXT_006922 [Thalassiosira profunda]